MKSPTSRLLPLLSLAAGSVLVALTGCTRQERADVNAKAQEVYADSKAALSNAWNDVKAYTYEKRADFQASARSLGSRMDAQISELRAEYSEAKASSSRKAAMNELKDSEADYKQKLDALGDATAATWESAKQNVIAAWDRLQASYDKARAD